MTCPDKFVSVVCLLSMLGSALASQHDAKKPDPGRQLPPSTRPVAPIAGLNSADIVSVSEMKNAAGMPPTRVFRYSFRGSFLDVVKHFQQTLSKKDGWQFERTDPHENDFWREPKDGKVAMQGLLIFDARLNRSRWSETGWAPAPPNRSHGWVWVSYNERLRR